MTLKNIVKLDNYYFPCGLVNQISRFVDYYNNEKYYESLNNVKPSDVYFGRHHEIESERERIKQKTMKLRKKINLKNICSIN